MATTLDDIWHDQMLEELHYEAVMKRAALEQCIYIFVEGESEETTFQMLLEDTSCGLDFEHNGIIIANYNGIGNLKHAIRLLRKTLSHDRPIIVTFDDDPDGKRNEKHLNDPLIFPFKIPQSPTVTFSDGSTGGSFEEAFSQQCFIESSFSAGVLPTTFSGTLSEFSTIFEVNRPWFPQLASFVTANGGNAASINKVHLAECMAEACHPVPETFIKLAELALELREKHPIRHPEDVKF
ncbi:MAG: hypothetical protein JZU65_23860 [Chlorobium sp.]|nr:hypothetical protein [Chlorobium sp.]